MFPDYLDGAKVLEYTESGHFGFTTYYDENDNPIETEIRYFAVCTYIGSNEYCLFSCDQRYNVVADICFDTIAVCKTCHPNSEGAVWHKKDVPHLYTAAQRKKALGGTLYFEFQRGRFRGKHWLDRSVYLHADLFDQLKLYEIFAEALPHFAYYGPTEVTPGQYDALRSLALARGGEIAAIFKELDHWIRDCFLTETVFTILGI